MLNVNFLPRCLAVAEVGYDGEEEVWKPRCQDRREIGLDGEGGRNRLEHDVSHGIQTASMTPAHLIQ